MVGRFTTVPAIFSRDIFTITRPETNGDACSGDRLTTEEEEEEEEGRGREGEEGGRRRIIHVEAVLVAGRKKFEPSGGNDDRG